VGDTAPPAHQAGATAHRPGATTGDGC